LRNIKELIDLLENDYNIKIKNIDLIEKALTHTSKEISW